jgi:poly-gamma-glutamate synthesis protein (capsule biosynthesis protein)
MSKSTKKLLFLIIALTIAIGLVSYFLLTASKNLNSSEKNASINQVFLASLHNNKQIYEDIFENLQEEEKLNAAAGIVPHHFLAKEMIAEFYNKFESSDISTVFLICPDHFNHFFPTGKMAYTSKYSWNTPFGELETEKQIIDFLLENGKVQEDNFAIGLEHGIYVEIPFLKKFFKNAKIVPLVLNASLNYEKFADLGELLRGFTEKNSILIVSSDFSHNVSLKQADKNDKNSVSLLGDIDKNSINKITTDCKQCISALYGFLGQKKYKFELAANKNSSDFSTETEKTVTSYISGFYTEKKDIRILLAGDLMFDRGIRYFAKKNGSNEFIFNKIYPILANNDLVVANLEGPITDNNSISSGTAPGSEKNYTFTFDKSVAQTLYAENIKLVNLGNNHILNFAKAGLYSTEKYLKEAGVDFFGGPDSNRTIIKKIEDFKIGFVGYNEFFGSAQLDEAQTIAEIQNLKDKTDFIIVMPHWGIEYTAEPTEVIREMAHQFINAGADLIIGSHPHVIQSIEEYNGKKIYYSLGNFVFDQYFSEAVRNGLGVQVIINTETKTLELKEINFYLNSNGQTILKN